jgi:hypothetical protein
VGLTVGRVERDEEQGAVGNPRQSFDYTSYIVGYLWKDYSALGLHQMTPDLPSWIPDARMDHQ